MSNAPTPVFMKYVNRVLGNEGGYVNNPADPGGETNWGITKNVAVANDYHGDMHSMTRDDAIQIYYTAFWQKVNGDALHPAIGYQCLDVAVNSGVHEGITLLQRALGVPADGVWGGASQKAADSAKDDVVLCLLLAERLELMTSLPIWQNFSKGWSRRVAADLRYAAADIA